MNKRLLVLAVAAAFGASGAAIANDKHGHDLPSASINGHIESVFTLTDDFDEESESSFNTEGEISVRAMPQDDVYARIDLDLNSRYSAGDETVEIEQIYGAWRMNDMAKLKIGRFNNPLGYERQDPTMKTSISRSLISELLDGQTELYQNNIEGVAVHLDLGPAKVTLGALNEIGGTPEENSFLAHVSGEVIPGLHLGLGMLTQEDVGDSADLGSGGDFEFGSFESLINFNAAYYMDLGGMAGKVYADYLTAGEILDMAYSVGGHLQVADAFGVSVRYDLAEFDGGAEFTSITAGLNYRAADNVDLRAEWRNDDDDVEDGDTIQMSAVFKF